MTAIAAERWCKPFGREALSFGEAPSFGPERNDSHFVRRSTFVRARTKCRHFVCHFIECKVAKSTSLQHECARSTFVRVTLSNVKSGLISAAQHRGRHRPIVLTVHNVTTARDLQSPRANHAPKAPRTPHQQLSRNNISTFQGLNAQPGLSGYAHGSQGGQSCVGGVESEQTHGAKRSRSAGSLASLAFSRTMSFRPCVFNKFSHFWQKRGEEEGGGIRGHKNREIRERGAVSALAAACATPCLLSKEGVMPLVHTCTCACK